ncbi:fibrous sheath CABYR-binding protein-like [Cajanus cajan]|uniref:fibrous sheath CABYR-binding protein-like n=1 Tax=Cajanus cajan TaxID=3821 RepID=UPI0010FB67DB|nr:fibrous sheath CABYR-binding protein-like [Cajanus cajan]XP_029125622.1 fibrous sheath CABYR-binding protein-like [Cajanus cajan]
MGKNKWRELKHHYNFAEIEVLEPQEKEISPLKVNRKRNRGEKEVGGTSAPRGTEEVTSKAADADAVDLTRSPPSGEAPQMVATATAEQVAPSAEAGIAAEVEAPVAEQVAQATVAGDAVEVQVPPRSEVPGVDPPIVEQGTPVFASVEARGKGPSLEVPTTTPATSAAPSSSSQGASQSQYIAHRFGKGLTQVRLDHVSASADMNSLWSSGVTADKFFPRGSLSSEDQGMIEEVGPVEGFDAAQVLL